jgi:N-acetylglutamate synthase-like GNAT family acetyltransferase
VAEDDEVIGMIRFIAKYSVEKLGVKTSHDKRECGFISDGFVTKSKRRMGVLSLLLQRAESAAKEANVKYVYLTTFKSYMVSFCKKQGYTEVNSTVFLKQLK